MLSERMLTKVIKVMTKRELALKPTDEQFFPAPNPGERYMLYMHVPFCERLCPYCSFNRYAFREDIARPYFEHMRKEMLMVKDLGYDIESIYCGGGTPTILLDELCKTLDLARETWDIKEVASETNPNHLTKPYLEQLTGRVQRLSVGVQSFNDDLLKQMDRYEKYGSGEEIKERIAEAEPYFDLLNVDMIFNFPSQTEDILRKDLETLIEINAKQTTFSPLYVSSATSRKMQATLGKMDWDREYRFYRIIDDTLAGGDNPRYHRSTIWTFSLNDGSAAAAGAQAGAGDMICGGRSAGDGAQAKPAHIEEYQTNYDEYPAIGSGSVTHLNGNLYVNNFSIKDYNAAIDASHMSIMGKSVMSKRDLMRYSFLVELYKLRLDKKAFERRYGCTVEAGLPMEMTFMRANKAFATNTAEELTLTPMGRYLTLVMYRQFLSGLNNLRDQARAALKGEESKLTFGDGTQL
ncbi:MAG: radical SAM protein [Coriobacteriia bacterium]|nr:radical SAM protein [Coriobacteriia bacterium]MBS5478081.1 radical SAM protein [Coriobacteriia bacterium]